MANRKYTEEQIVNILKEAQAGIKTEDCGRGGLLWCVKLENAAVSV
jgi:hypothetical protein